MAWKLQRKKEPAPPTPEPATGNPPPADDLVPAVGRSEQAAPQAAVPATGSRRTVLDDGTIIEESALGKVVTIPSRPAAGIADPRWWRRR
jgi:hypothetical protein